jgi:hypothetical protein
VLCTEPFPDVLCRVVVLGASLLALVVPEVFGVLLAAVVDVCLGPASLSVPAEVILASFQGHV